MTLIVKSYVVNGSARGQILVIRCVFWDRPPWAGLSPLLQDSIARSCWTHNNRR